MRQAYESGQGHRRAWRSAAPSDAIITVIQKSPFRIASLQCRSNRVYSGGSPGYPVEYQFARQPPLTIKQMAMVAAVVMVFVLSLHRFVVPSGTAEPLQHGYATGKHRAICSGTSSSAILKAISPARKPFWESIKPAGVVSRADGIAE